MSALRSLAALLTLLLASSVGAASPVDCSPGDPCDVPAASLAPAPAPSSFSAPVPLLESLGLCLVGAAGVAAGVLLARRA